MPSRWGLPAALTIIAGTAVGYRLVRDRPAAGPAGMLGWGYGPQGGTRRGAALRPEVTVSAR
ncbi:hypothetical protein [Streptomyces sp. NPDC048669]|uniref:hypothetical protein n=1 Tax=Streptomyces sp. NPDC048669 TaxID=3155267 RepID=UPI00341824C1